MRIVTLKDGMGFPFAQYNDGDIFISNDFLAVKHDNEPVKTTMTIVCLCTQGSGTISINDTTYNYSDRDMVVIAPYSIICGGTAAKQSKFRIMAFDGLSMRNNIVVSKDMWTSLMYVKNNPVCKLSDYQYKVMNHYFELAYLYVQNTHDIYQKDKMSNLTRCWIYDLLTMISEYSDYKSFNKERFSSNDVMFQKFIEILSLHNGKMRSVQSAAKQMCMSPKYLTYIVKQVSGKTPQTFIHEFTINAIKEQLKYSGKSIKEISNDMDFTEPSFFGKFFKQHTSMTPLEYRRQVLQQQKEPKEDLSSANRTFAAENIYSQDAKLNEDISSLYSALGFMCWM